MSNIHRTLSTPAISDAVKECSQVLKLAEDELEKITGNKDFRMDTVLSFAAMCMNSLHNKQQAMREEQLREVLSKIGQGLPSEIGRLKDSLVLAIKYPTKAPTY
jgi:hypothetical protein